ncbi:TIGR03032 family protein [Mesorhizobium comanense]|uniref:TIGR03032 family protein n=1 Tax=Mesorhizobium comanense TaxID=2502215 RepID=UPI0014850FE5|nr:TIGR03032 family protein [Mesorhizobium comanense]
MNTPKAADEATANPAQAEPAEQQTNVSLSRGFIAWLETANCSLAFTSYQTGQLFLVGLTADKKASIHQTSFTRAMGVTIAGQRIILASDIAVWRLENILGPGQVANNVYDRMYVPRAASYTGDLDIHELAVREDGQIVFINTKFSCLATLSPTHSFRPLWKPSFISKLVPEDRCHLNGLAMQNGRARYVSAISRSDSVSGWRDRRWEGGMIIDITEDKVVVDDLSMPHSPRVHDGALWVLDSGRGFLVRIDPKTGEKQNIAFCPGFLRGLSFHGRFAMVTTSLPRDGLFKDLPLQANLEARDAEPRCALYIIDLHTGGIAEWIELKGHITELFDISVIPACRCPSSVPLNSPNMASLITIDSEA